jgi:hypothetical protein
MLAMKLQWILFFVILGTSIGCKDLKDQQLGAYVGDSQTKVVYKNVGKNTTIVPESRRVFFKSQSEATDQGYTPSNVAGESSGSSDE